MKWFKTAPVLLVAIVILAIGLRLPLLNGSFWLDEAAQALESDRPLSQQLELVPDFQPPLLHLLIHFALYVDRSEWWLRTVGALIPGIITVILTVLLGDKVFNKRVGWISGLLLATSSFHIFFSQELRQYSLPVMWAVATWLLLWLSVKRKEESWWLGVSWGVLSLAGWYSSYLYPFLWLAQVVFVTTLTPHKWREWSSGIAITVLGFLPWLPMFLRQLQAGQSLRTELPGWENVVSFSQLKAIPLTMGKFIFGVVNLEANAFFIGASLLLGVLGVGIVALLSKKMSRNQVTFKATPLVMILIWLVVPLLTAWLVSFFVPVIQPKRVLFLLPACYLFVTWLALQTQQHRLGQLLVVTLLSLNFWGVWQYWSNPLYQRENWRAAYHDISTQYPADDTLAIFAFPEAYAPWRWYNSRDVHTVAIGYLSQSPTQNEVSESLKYVTDYSYAVTFDYLQDLSDPQRLVPQTLHNFGYKEVQVLDYPNVGFIRIYARQGVTVSQL